MTIDFTQVILDQDDKPINDPMAGAGKDIPLTLGRAVSHALNGMYPDEQSLSGEEKFNRGMLAFRVRDDTAAELKAEDIVLIKKTLAKLYGPAVIYRAYQILENK